MPRSLVKASKRRASLLALMQRAAREGDDVQDILEYLNECDALDRATRLEALALFITESAKTKSKTPPA